MRSIDITGKCNINKIRFNLHWTPTHKINDFVPKLLQKELF